MSELQGVVISLRADHVKIPRSATSLWAKVRTVNGEIVMVWILKETGNGRRIETQKTELEKANTHLVGKRILYYQNRNDGRFFRRLVDDPA